MDRSKSRNCLDFNNNAIEDGDVCAIATIQLVPAIND